MSNEVIVTCLAFECGVVSGMRSMMCDQMTCWYGAKIAS